MSTLTPADIAADLKVSTETALRHLREHRIPGFKAGRFWRVESDEYAAWKAADARPADPNRIAPRSPRGMANLNRRRTS